MQNSHAHDKKQVSFMENTKKIIEAFFNSKDKIVYGFVVLQKFYGDLCTITDENKEISCSLYPLLSSLNDSMQYAVNHVDLNYLCDDFRWPLFTQNVLTISSSMLKNEKRREIQALIQFNELVGKNLANCNLEVKKKWYESLSEFIYDNTKQEYQEVVSRCIFSFLKSQILFDNNNLVLSYFYDKLLKNEIAVSECFIRVFLLTSCYLYYLGYREDERYVNDQDKELRSRCKKIFDQSIGKFKNILKEIAYRDVNLTVAPYNVINIFNTTLLSFMKDSLCLCEFIPEEFKTIIMENVVNEFIFHCFVYIKCKNPFLDITINKIIDDEQAESLFLKFKTNDTIYQWHNFFVEIFNGDELYEMIYNSFVKELENVYKQNLIKKGKMPKEENHKIIEEKISQRISAFFGAYKKDTCTNYASTNLLSNASIPNFIKIEELLSSFMDCVQENIVITLFNRMNKNNEATLFKRSSLINENFLEYPKTDDENLLELIEKHKGHVYIGGDSLLRPNNFCSYNDRYNNAVNGLSKMHNTAGLLGIFIDPAKVKIFVKNISISRAAQTIQDSGAIEINGEYKYAPSVGIEMTYTKEELEEYLKLNKSVLTISADVGYDIAPETKVDFICME